MQLPHLAIIWIIAINLIAFAAFGIDKRRARNGERRISERALLTLAALGGTIGAWLGRRVFRHKTRKEDFSKMLFIIAAAQAAMIIFFDISA